MEKIESQSISVVILKSISASVKRVLIRLKTVDNFPCLSTMPFLLLIPSPELSFLFHEGSICLLLNSFFSVYVHPLELRVPTASFHFVPFLSLLGQTASVFAAIILKKKICGASVDLLGFTQLDRTPTRSSLQDQPSSTLGPC